MISQDILHIGELIDEFESLEYKYEAVYEDMKAYEDGIEGAEQPEIEDEDEYAQYVELTRILDELRGCGGDFKWRGDWYPDELINEDYFTEYCKLMVEELYPDSIPHFVAVDWERTAENIKADYDEIEIFGSTFYYRV